MSSDSTSTPDLPPDWERPALADIAQVNPPLDRCIIAGDVSVNFVPMRAVEAEGGGLLHPEVRAYSEVKKGYTSFLSGDVIMAKITPCMENGKTTVVPELPGSVCFGSTEFHVLRPEPGVDPRWIRNFLLHHETRRTAQRAMTGAVGQMRVPVSFLEAVRVPLAPCQHQVRIADVLDELFSDLDAGVAALEQARAKLKLYRASVLNAAVTGALTAEWRQQHPNVESATGLLNNILGERRRHWEGEQLRKFEKAGDVPPKDWRQKYRDPVAPDAGNAAALPEGWSWAALDQIAEIQGGVTKGQKFSAPDQTRLVPYLRVANVQRGFLDLRVMKVIRALEADIKALRLLPGDVLFNEGGDRDKLGRGWIWEGQIPECIHQNHVFRARLFSAGVQPRFVSWCGNSYGQLWFMKAGRQSVNLASINLTVLRSFPVPLPPTREQEAIIEAVEDHLSVVEHLESELTANVAKAGALRQSALRHAFAGQLVPQNPADEPASELLERIAAERDVRSREAAVAKRVSVAAKKKIAKKP